MRKYKNGASLNAQEKEALLKEILPFDASCDTKQAHNAKVIFTHIASTMLHLIERGYYFDLFELNFAKDIEDCEGDRFDKFKIILPILQKHYHHFTFEPFIKANMTFLQTYLHLKPLEVEVLYFYYIFDEMGFQRFFKKATLKNWIKIISSFFNVREHKMREILSENAPLRKLKFLEKDNYTGFEISDFAKEFFEKPLTKRNVLHNITSLVKPTKLHLADFDFMQEDITLLLNYFKKAKNPSIYLYGSPGVGKNEIASLLAKTLQKELFKISKSLDEKQYKSSNIQRFILAQNLLNSKNHIVLFDECEDIFADYSWRHFSHNADSLQKGLLNEMIESIKVPSIFLSNSCDIDPALLRRFGIVLEIKIPPKQKQIQLIESTLKTHKCQLDSKLIEKMAQNNLSTGILLNALKAAKTAPKNKAEQSALKVINEHLKLQDKKEIVLQKSNELPYDMGLINADIDVKKISEGIKNAQCGARILLYGAPGSGKSEYTKALAKELKKDIICKKGSDLLSMWVGGTEKNIAQAFREAREQKAILVFDEVDSFLQDRSDAQRSWEITQVNEMLTQMESFEGIFLATTNFLDTLDTASIRRFDMKISFKSLDVVRLEKAFLMYAHYLGLNDTQEFVKTHRQDFARLSNICFGDFALIVREARFNPPSHCEMLLERLYAESALKDSQKSKRMGF
ncbi:ATP-binding protein [Helicobacter sp. MIT 21-1697]|uniref:AAA family ATPase n=1 Tax=Helicobacter sp. MIT 21-1697 TaxID=2993733 RepID=UPI00224AD1F9|nr:ATP-binding protein [Helicobacter sp. MIT 21-1697]MCX2716953.1 ATP-binding protein [Helicobacter sp. MIT 21-1697]